MRYTIDAVSETVKDINGKYGAMKVYKLRLQDETETIDYMISSASSAPRVGDILEGTIGHNDFGAYFKKDKKPFTPQSIQSKPVTNTDAMYTAYAKDLMIAYLNALSWDFDKLDEVQFVYALAMIADGAETLQKKETK